MKRSGLSRTIVAIAMMLIGWLPSLAHDFEVEGVFYKKTSDNAVAVTYKGYSYDSYSNEYAGDVVIPSSVDYNGATYSVTSIGYAAFWECSNLTSIEIPNSVTSIGYEAFYNCSSLTSIEIPNGVTSIGNDAFWFCESLASVVIGNSVTSIGEWAFCGCSSLTSVVIGNSVTSIGIYAFSGCSSLASIEIPNSVTSIGDYAFQSCSSLTSVVIGNSVTSIGDYAFQSCSSLTSVVIGNSVTSIGDYAFRYCESLTSVVIGNSVTRIGNYAFSGCSSLTSIEIPNSVISIGDVAFYGCKNLSKITCLATTPPTITSNTFNSYSAKLYVPVGCKSAYESANYWYKFSNIIELEPEPEEGMAFEYGGLTYKVTVKGKELAVIASESGEYSGAVVIPLSVDYNDGITYSVTSIGDYAFYECSSLTSIQIPNSVTSIGIYAFSGCSSLTSIVVDSGNTKYDSRNGCNAIIETASNTLIAGCQNTIIPNSVTSIGEWAFYDCTNLTSIRIPNSVTSIGDDAFYGCESLTKITCLATNPPTIKSNTFNSYSAELYVPAGCISVYQSANYWKKFYNIKEITLSTSIALNQTTATLKASETITLVATVLPENATDKSVEWSSSDETVAVVDENGVVTAIAVGEATITATTTDGSDLSASCKVTVGFPISIIPEDGSTVKELQTIIFEFSPADYPNTMDYDSSKSPVLYNDAGEEVAIGYMEFADVATYMSLYVQFEAPITEEGVYTLKVPAGAMKEYGWGIANPKLCPAMELTYNVMSVKAESISLDKTEIEITIDETATLIATVLPENATNKSVTWKSSNEAVAVVDEDGVVTAVGVGEAIITAMTNDGSNLSASCKVTVHEEASANFLSGKTINTYSGASERVSVEMTNEQAITAFQCDIYLPDGISIATIDGEYDINLSSRAKSSHSLSCVEQSDGSIRLLCYSMSLATFSGNEGELFDINFNISKEIEGNYQVLIDNIVLTDKAQNEYKSSTTIDFNVKAYVPADVNNDGSINVTDVVATASYILGLDTKKFIFEAADMNKDGVINVTDIVGIASIILNGGTASNVSSQRCAPNTSDAIKIEDFATGKNQSQQVAIEMTNASDYSACQMDIRLPKGMSIAGCELASAATDHMVAYRELPDGAVRVLVYSLTCRTLPDSEEGIIRLRTTTDNRFEGGEIVVENILFADRGQNEYRLYDSVANVNLATGVSATDVDCVVYAENRSIVIISPCDQQATITSVDGVSRTYSLNEGRNEIKDCKRGIYIIETLNRINKLIIK